MGCTECTRLQAEGIARLQNSFPDSPVQRGDLAEGHAVAYAGPACEHSSCHMDQLLGRQQGAEHCGIAEELPIRRVPVGSNVLTVQLVNARPGRHHDDCSREEERA